MPPTSLLSAASLGDEETQSVVLPFCKASPTSAAIALCCGDDRRAFCWPIVFERSCFRRFSTLFYVSDLEIGAFEMGDTASMGTLEPIVEAAGLG